MAVRGRCLMRGRRLRRRRRNWWAGATQAPRRSSRGTRWQPQQERASVPYLLHPLPAPRRYLLAASHSPRLASGGGSPRLLQKVTFFSTQNLKLFLLHKCTTSLCCIFFHLSIDPRRNLPTVVKPKDPYTAESVSSPREKALIREAARSVVSVSAIAHGKIG